MHIWDEKTPNHFIVSELYITFKLLYLYLLERGTSISLPQRIHSIGNQLMQQKGKMKIRACRNELCMHYSINENWKSL